MQRAVGEGHAGGRRGEVAPVDLRAGPGGDAAVDVELAGVETGAGTRPPDVLRGVGLRPSGDPLPTGDDGQRAEAASQNTV